MTITSMGALAAYNSNSSKRQTSTDQAVTALGSDLTSANLVAAKEKVAVLKDTVQNQLRATSVLPSSTTSRTLSVLSQSLDIISLSIENGNLSAAQKAYGSLKSAYTSFRSMNASVSSGSTDTSNLISQLFGGSKSKNPTISSSENLSKVMSAYMYYLSGDGSIQQSTATGSTYNAQA
ncbi:MAG: hypothetical protein B9S32_04525 [Verrucomicrobia bacterium Tous-C9LFEB]|nr:MAG: hypothetical protein B9S32_04525 [Verrucomicrobia bacterium Tous-C9LFEB]